VESELMRGFALQLRALARARRGAVDGARADAEESLAICVRVGWPHGIAAARWALGCVALAEGDHQAVVDALGPVVSAVEAVGLYEFVWAMSLPDAVESLIAIGELEHAERLIDSIADCSCRLDRPWGLAEAERCRALLEAARGNLDAAIAAIDAAVAAHDRLAMPFERGRTLLVKGIMHRRARHKKAAREALEEALTTLEGIGAAPWAERSRTELRRVGLRAPAPEQLTETERRVAELAATGLTNKQVAARAFLAPKSVEDVLARVYRKLAIHSRAELGAKMAARTRD
jgi:DNA-binding NarL/FixJ family response regulator